MQREGHGRSREFDAVFLSFIHCHPFTPRDVSREVSVVGAVYDTWRTHQLPLFLVSLTFIGNYQESCGMKTGWGAVILAEAVGLIAASTVHRVCITTCFLFSTGLLYEINKISGVTVSKSESKAKRH